MDALWLVLSNLGTALTTGFAQWVFYIRKHKADASGAEKTNDRTEIENLKLINKEWMETAMSWKAMADEYRTKYIALQPIVEELQEKLVILSRQLNLANERIEHLEAKKGISKVNTHKTPSDGNEQ